MLKTSLFILLSFVFSAQCFGQKLKANNYISGESICEESKKLKPEQLQSVMSDIRNGESSSFNSLYKKNINFSSKKIRVVLLNLLEKINSKSKKSSTIDCSQLDDKPLQTLFEIENSNALVQSSLKNYTKLKARMRRFKETYGSISSEGFTLTNLSKNSVNVCGNKYVFNGEFGENCSLLPSRTQENNGSSLSNILRVAEDQYLLSSSNMARVDFGDDPSKCNKCLGDLVSRNNLKRSVRKSKSKVLKKLNNAKKTKQLAKNFLKLSGVLENLVNFSAVREEVFNKNKISQSCFSMNSLNSSIKAQCGKRKRRFSQKEIASLFHQSMKSIGVDMNKEESIVDALRRKLSFSNNKQCKKDKEGKQLNSRAIYQQMLTEQMYSNIGSPSSMSLSIVMNSLDQSFLKKLCDNNKENMTPLALLRKRINKNFNDLINNRVSKDVELYRDLYREYSGYNTKDSKPLRDNSKNIKDDDDGFADYIIENVLGSDPLLKILIGERRSKSIKDKSKNLLICKHLNTGNSSIKDFIMPSSNKSVTDILISQEKVLSDYAQRCEDISSKIAEIVCSEDLDENKMKESLSENAYKNLLSDVARKISKEKIKDKHKKAHLVNLGLLNCASSGLNSSGTEKKVILDIGDAYYADEFSSNDVSSILENEIFLQSKDILKDDDIKDGDVINFQNATDKIFCKENLKESPLKDLIANKLYNKPIEERTRVLVENSQRNSNSGDFMSPFAPKKFVEYVKSGGDPINYKPSSRKTKSVDGVVERVTSGGVANSFVSSGSKGKSEDRTTYATKDSVNKGLGGASQQDFSPSMETLNNNFTGNYNENLLNASKVDELFGEKDDKYVQRDLASETDSKFESKLEELKKELENLKKDKEFAEKKSQKYQDEISDLKKLKDKDDEIKNLEKKKAKLDNEIKENEKKILSTKKQIASGGLPAKYNQKITGETSYVDSSSLLRPKPAFAANPNNYYSGASIPEQAKRQAIRNFNRNPVYSFQMQQPPTGLRLEKLVEQAKESDFNIKYDGKGRPWLIQIAGQTQYFDLKEMTEDQRKKIFEKLHLKSDDISGKKVEEIAEKEITDEAKKIRKVNPVINKEGLRILALKQALNNAISRKDRALATVLLGKVK